jgi:4-carboxymuconolactone decarboxylase
MPDQPAFPKAPFGDVAPALARYTDEVLVGDLWTGPTCRRAIAAWSR